MMGDFRTFTHIKLISNCSLQNHKSSFIFNKDLLTTQYVYTEHCTSTGWENLMWMNVFSTNKSFNLDSCNTSGNFSCGGRPVFYEQLTHELGKGIPNFLVYTTHYIGNLFISILHPGKVILFKRNGAWKRLGR